MNPIVKCRNSLRLIILYIKKFYDTKLLGMKIHPTARVSFRAYLDKTHPNGIHIGKESYVASGAIIFTHDFSRGLLSDTFIGNKCFIGSNAIIMCGIKIGDECIIGSGSIVTKDVPSNSIVCGNPAKIIREHIHTKRYGQLI